MYRTINICNCGGYLSGSEFNEGLAEYFDKIFEAGDMALYKCKSICERCPGKVETDRSDSGAGLAGEFSGYVEERKRAGEKIEEAVKQLAAMMKEFRDIDMNP